MEEIEQLNNKHMDEIEQLNNNSGEKIQNNGTKEIQQLNKLLY